MSLGIELRDGSGRVVDGIGEETDFRKGIFPIPAFDDLRYPLLRLVSRYHDTVFNSHQMHGLVPELEALLAETLREADAKFVGRVLELARQCRVRPHWTVVFVGD